MLWDFHQSDQILFNLFEQYKKEEEGNLLRVLTADQAEPTVLGTVFPHPEAPFLVAASHAGRDG